MGITDEQYRWIIDKSYWVDKNKTDCEYHIEENKTYNFSDNDTRLGEFRVLSAKDNNSNGMQAMAVAPVDKNGNVDYSHVVIAYAGTNKDDIKDLDTDVQSLGLGRDKLQSRSGLNSAKVVDSQFVTALNYAKVN